MNKLLENLDLKTVYGKDILKHNLLENNYITPISSDDIDIEDEILKMDAGELSNILKQNGIIAFGKKRNWLSWRLKIFHPWILKTQNSNLRKKEENS